MFGFGKDKKVSTESYKGVRDFYPEEQAVQNYIFNTWKKVAQSYGYSEYNASILEPLELYKSKTSEEIVNEQIYSFKDRGDREVALRPEMTPTVARMIAGRLNEIPLPARWYSIPNIFRYEKPQRGRLREHWQFNVDLFGPDSAYADAEIIAVGADIMKTFGARSEDFEIRVNSRGIMNALYKELDIPVEKNALISRIIDKKDKIPKEAFAEALAQEVDEKSGELVQLVDNPEGIFEFLGDDRELARMTEVMDILWKRDVQNVIYKPTLTRGFDYYTGVIFEIFDTNPANTRSIFGGGRYDDLLSLFNDKKVPAVGFGLGDVTMRDFLDTHKLLPEFKSKTQVWIVIAPETDMGAVYKTADNLRSKGMNVGVDISGKKLGDQIASAEKRKIPYVLVVGKDEIEKGKFKLKNMATREEKEVSLDEIAGMVR